MSLAGLELRDLRCIRHATLELGSGCNLILGPNGAGKTSVLEAIYLLGRGRSFRTRHTERLVRRGAGPLQSVGRLYSAGGLDGGTIGFAFDLKTGPTARVDRQDVHSLADLALAFPVQVIDPSIHQLVEEGPAFRRRWLDWGVFHVEHGFASLWQQYNRGLKQRNAALASGADTAPWDPELIRTGESLALSREALVEQIRPIWEELISTLVQRPVHMSFHRGWSRERTLAEAFRASALSDRERGSTGVGPHRFDVALTVEGAPAREVLSRGQQKLTGAALVLALSRKVAEAGAAAPTLLVDDPAAELDGPHTAMLLNAVASLAGQLIVTALEPVPALIYLAERRFHVEQGGVQQV